MKNLLLLSLFLSFAFLLKSQTVPVKYTFKEPVVNINFGTGEIGDRTATSLPGYRFVPYSCPSDGHYTYASSTAGCFGGDWLTLPEDHTPGDGDGNMMIVNASYRSGPFFTTTINRLKGGTTYEFSVWMINLCRPTEKCPFPLLPEISMQIQTSEGKSVTGLVTGEMVRKEVSEWTKYQVIFETPPSDGPLTLTMTDNAPGGCGNDFAMDDISFRERVEIPVVITKPKAPAIVKKETPPAKPVIKKPAPAPVVKVPPVVVKTTPKKDPPVVVKAAPKKDPPSNTVAVVKKKPPVLAPVPEKAPPQVTLIAKPQPDVSVDSMPVPKPKPAALPPAPPIVATRANPVVKQIEMAAGEIKVDLYDNGEIDGDTVSVYHNNVLLVDHARLEIKPISFRIAINAAHPHHELVLVAHNLGSIPPNTSLMVVTAGSQRFEVFISSNEQKNAKVILDLKE